ncbi:hypothetical protein [Brazilian marseillevirus]|uniref:hypothetical protein n=1 Tax=Brazilian marseillevirus TaxID=1813599 RepID=UPI0007848E38|nr:hypothetical protein A3303_gp186 [Brazilian marseillevirus]AMQ10694.1 hypothetical protein [Brazilian marseillevirus]
MAFSHHVVDCLFRVLLRVIRLGRVRLHHKTGRNISHNSRLKRMRRLLDDLHFECKNKMTKSSFFLLISYHKMSKKLSVVYPECENIKRLLLERNPHAIIRAMNEETGTALHYSQNGKFSISMEKGETIYCLWKNDEKAYICEDANCFLDTASSFIRFDPAYSARETCGRLKTLNGSIERLNGTITNGIEFAPGTETFKEIQKNFEVLQKL